MFVNLASTEYFSAIDVKALKVPVIIPEFKDYKNGKYKIISFYAKRARGLMARYCAQNSIVRADEIKEFDSEGYAYCEEESDFGRWVFRRKLAD